MRCHRPGDDLVAADEPALGHEAVEGGLDAIAADVVVVEQVEEPPRHRALAGEHRQAAEEQRVGEWPAVEQPAGHVGVAGDDGGDQAVDVVGLQPDEVRVEEHDDVDARGRGDAGPHGLALSRHRLVHDAGAVRGGDGGRPVGGGVVDHDDVVDEAGVEGGIDDRPAPSWLRSRPG